MAPKHKPIQDALLSLVNEGQTGMLVIYGGYGFKAKLYLRAGCVYHAECDTLVGVQAIRSIAKRKAVRTLFVPDMGPEEVVRTRFGTDQVLYLFKQADQVWEILRKSIPDYDLVFDLADGAQYDSVATAHQSVLSALDGCRSVHQVIKHTGLPEMDVLYAIYFYASVGLIRRSSSVEGDLSNVCRIFIGKLKEELRRSSPPSMLPARDPVCP